MNERRGTCGALPRASGILLWAAVAFANGCASRDDATDDLHGPDAHVYACTIGQGLLLGSLEVFSESGTTPTCRIGAPEPSRSSRQYCASGPGGTLTCPDCNDLQKSLGCSLTMTR